ncbi:PHO85 cyclin-1 [Fusarium albosuccineum]|uniref:PHO85 cyclin-1 n=1 Tax=Fusarium albosuccineum TaxID=1237068 RepID=A0A8H4LP53_9HYPO|nr:PHO85 cyclin-1 [Fusarium albosuccineum]
MDGKRPIANMKSAAITQTERLTPYNAMVIQSHEELRVYSLLAAIFNWVFLAGFIVFPGTFTSLGRTSVLSESQAGRVMQQAIRPVSTSLGAYGPKPSDLAKQHLNSSCGQQPVLPATFSGLPRHTSLEEHVSLEEHISLEEHVSLEEHISLEEHVSLEEHISLEERDEEEHISLEKHISLESLEHRWLEHRWLEHRWLEHRWLEH